MHGDVGTTVQEGQFEFLEEKPFAAQGCERRVVPRVRRVFVHDRVAVGDRRGMDRGQDDPDAELAL